MNLMMCARQVAAEDIIQCGAARQVMILDLDVHQVSGSAIAKRLNAFITFV
jgi:hypothetical protein